MSELDAPVRIPILWEDTSAMVVAKPAGLLTQGARGVPSLETHLRAQLRERVASRDGGETQSEPYMAFAHRIDRPVSGVLLVARNVRAARRFGEQFQSRKVGKQYMAICAGSLSAAEGEWIDWVRKIPDRAHGEVVTEGDPGARRAVLRWERIAEIARTAGEGTTGEGTLGTLVRVELETGRMHQIRLQFAHRGHALWGDEQYGSTVAFGPAVEDRRQRAIALHARQIVFHHPKTGVRTTVVAELPEMWAEGVRGGLRWLRQMETGG